MPKFWKEVLRPGKYLVTAEDGSRKVEEFTPERLAKQAETHNAMHAAGLLVPVPWSHAEWLTPVSSDAEKKALKTKHNAGFTEEARITDSGALEILHDIPLKADAERMGTTVREVSPYIRKTWTDGTGKTWDDAILHSALVTNPIMPGQANFRPAEEALAIALSHMIPDGFDLKAFGMSGDGATLQNGSVPPPTNISSVNPNIDDVLVALRDVGLVLPTDTTYETLGTAIIIAGTALKGANADQQDGAALKPGERTASPPVGVALSHQDQTMIDNKKLDAAVAYASNLAKKGYKDRILALVGVVTTKAFADTKLYPLADGFAMSFADDGTVMPSALDTLLESLEAAAAEKKADPAATNSGSALSHGERFLSPQARDTNGSSEDEKAVADAYQQGVAARNEELKRRGFAPAV